MPEFNSYTLVTLLSAIVILTIGICLFTVSMPRGVQLHHYRISRRMLGTAYLLLALQSLVGVFWSQPIHTEMIIPLIQAFLFTYALITLLNHDYLTRRRIVWQVVIISLIIFVIILNIYLLPAPVEWMSSLVMVAYFGLFAYYVRIFFREYRHYKRRADNFYAGNERTWLRWVLQIFIIASAIGATAGMITADNIGFWIFIILYTLIYVYLAIRYINYVTLFYRIAPAVTERRDETAGRTEVSNETIRAALDEWTERKGFLSPDVSLESLAQEFRINPAYLSRFINSEYGQNFRSWINSKRISEAQTIIIEQKELSFAEVGEEVGIRSVATFYRHFATVTGMSPAEYRRRFANDTKAG